jgi:SNF2 family DNA or RNA helicase
MKGAFEFQPSPTGGHLSFWDRRLLGKRAVPADQWSELSNELQPVVRYINSLLRDGRASSASGGVDLPIPAILEMSGGIAAKAGLPEVASLAIELQLKGRIEAENGEIAVIWRDATARVVRPRRIGVCISFGGTRARLSPDVFALISAIDAYNRTRGEAPESRIALWTPVQEHLESTTGEKLAADALLRRFKIFQAGAFALDFREGFNGPSFDPVPMAASKRTSLRNENRAPEDGELPDDDSALPDNVDDGLLPPDLQTEFARAFNVDGTATRASYVVARNTYLVVDRDLRRALDVVKTIQRSDRAERRRFLKNPRSYIAEALFDIDTDLAGTLFVETQQYSDRVVGLGLWQKPDLSWLARKSTGWLPEGFLFRIGSHDPVEVSEGDLKALGNSVEDATRNGEPMVRFRSVDYDVDEVAEALEMVRVTTGSEREDQPGEDEGGARDDSYVLQIDDNIEDVAVEESLRPRRRVAPRLFPSDHILSEPKEHQLQGFSWLVENWSAGRSGVLLADDMGLGKTLQALAFLAWFRINRSELGTDGKEITGPILIVAPTALLRNWQQEAERHLIPDALGDCLEIFGSGLRAVKRPKTGDWTPEDALDVDRIRHADWILTTYETLATYHRAFARVHYGVLVFDEIQKIKAPDTINTHSAKAMNANFVIGLTGTPIENRIEDLWCVMDRVSPGYLGSLKDFSARYGNEDADALRELKTKLDEPAAAFPGIMLRRMKTDHLKGLPEREIRNREATMPPAQASAYEEVVAAARSRKRSKGEMLKAIHDMRGISLHPYGRSAIDVTDLQARKDWISDSARVAQTLEILRDVREKQEKALIYIEDRNVQQIFAEVIAAEFGMDAVPAIINGSVSGSKRQDIVNRFQQASDGFDVLVLSPKAAGIGLTITAANHVIHLSRWWNPAVEDQCNDRVYRIGQERQVFVHIPMALHPRIQKASFDAKLDELLERKRALSRDMLAPPVVDGDVDALFEQTVGGEQG